MVSRAWLHICISCDVERKKDEQKPIKPIFSAKLDDPHDMKALKKVFGGNALNHAFGPTVKAWQKLKEMQ